MPILHSPRPSAPFQSVVIRTGRCGSAIGGKREEDSQERSKQLRVTVLAVQYQDVVLALDSTGPVGLPRTQRESTGLTAAASFG